MIRECAIVMIAGGAVLAGGCADTQTESPTTKREQDRVAMQLDDAQRERTELRSRIEKMRAELADADKRNDQTKAQFDELSRRNAELTRQTEELQHKTAAAGSGATQPVVDTGNK